MGGSPVLVTSSFTLRRPLLISMSPLATLISPGIKAQDPGKVEGFAGHKSKSRVYATHSYNWLMHGGQLGAVGKRRVGLDLGNHLGHALHHVLALEERRAIAHELRDALPVARCLEDRRGDERDGFGIVQLEPPRAAALGHERGGEDEKLVLLARGELHIRCSRSAASSPRGPRRADARPTTTR